MEIIIIYVVLGALLFLAAYSAKRRFGLLGLALAAGSLLSGIWGYDAGLMASGLGAPNNSMSSAVIASIIILLPAIVLLFHGYEYKMVIGRVIGAILFTLLAMAFLIEPLSKVFVVQGIGADVYKWLIGNRTFVIGAGLIVAVVDIFLTKPAPVNDKHHKH